MNVQQNMTGINIKLTKPQKKIRFDKSADSSWRHDERLNWAKKLVISIYSSSNPEIQVHSKVLARPG